MSGNKLIKIQAFPRIHVTLIAMNENGLRVNGGVGFSIKQPGIILEISSAGSFQIDDERAIPLDTPQLDRLRKRISSIKAERNLRSDIKVTIKGNLPVHSGFGSGTIIRLACIEGLLIMNNIDYTEPELVSISGRGGTSGIGIRTYFNGGYIFDIGHRNREQKLLPSSSKEDKPIQTLSLLNGDMPNWPIGICFPIKPIDKCESEETFFKNNTKIDNKDVYETLYHVLYGVIAGVIENDIEAFQHGINSIQSCRWKCLEKGLYNDAVYDVERVLYKNGATMVGMSSLGPGLFFLAPDLQATIEYSKQEIISWNFTISDMNNCGRKILIQNA